MGVFRSYDAGLHWTAANTGLPAVNGQVDAALVATEPTEPAAVWVAGSQERALYRSTNLGARWRYAGWGLKGVVLDVTAHPQTAGVVFAATDQGLFRSADSGRHWSRSGLRGSVVSRVVFDPMQPRHLYAVTLEEGILNTVIGMVFVSDDRGASWKEGREQPPAYGSFDLVADPAHADTAWLSSKYGFFTVFRTTDGGQPDPSRPGALYVQEICCALWKRTGAGQPFTSISTGFDSLGFIELILDPRAWHLVAVETVHAQQ